MARLHLLIVVCFAIAFLSQFGDASPSANLQRTKRQTNLEIRDCTLSSPYYPSTIFLSQDRLDELRDQMRLSQFLYKAYIIPGYDAHGSEFPADPDKRIYYMSGFNGTGGFAIVTLEKAVVWTYERFNILAQQQLDCNWEIMILDDEDYLTPWEWLIRDDKNLRVGELPGAGLDLPADVGFDPLLMPYTAWYDLSRTNELESRRVNLVTHEEDENLVDLTWAVLQNNQPKDPYPGERLYIQDTELYAGFTWQEKIFQTIPNNPTGFKNVRTIMEERDSDALVLTKLDEIAWLFNMRGEDIPYNPLFIAYCIITTNSIQLYLYDSARRLDQERYLDIVDHLELESTRCSGGNVGNRDQCISASNSEDFPQALQNIISTKKVWFSNSSNYFVYDTIVTKYLGDEKRYMMEPSPILLMKAVKNDVEIDAMTQALVADSVTMIEMATWMDNLLQDMLNPKEGDARVLDEYMVSERTETVRRSQATYMYPSYETIAAVGPNSGNYFYYPQENDDIPIPTGKMFLYDMGGQYREGTTTLTRTFFFSKEKDGERSYPTDFQMEVYTRVLLGHINLANTSFRSNVYGRDLDAIAREPLWDIGLDFFHATGYGVGQYLTVHEGPVYINRGFTPEEQPFNRSMIISNGPGYYSQNQNPLRDNSDDFGVRITNVMQVVESNTPYNYGEETYLEFEPISLVPFEPRLIKFEYFSRQQLAWYNEYNQKIRDELGGKLSGNAREWMMSRTRFQKYRYEYIGAASSISIATTAIVVSICSALVLTF